MDSIALMAMLFARRVHRDQRRKYTGNPYTDHLAEVAGIVASVTADPGAIAVAWLHDCVEDCGVTQDELTELFGECIASEVMMLSDLETGSRAERKAASRLRLAQVPWWVQTIKVADLISNTSSIVEHDPKFAVTYLEEKRLLLDVLKLAHPGLMDVARRQLAEAREKLA